MDDVLGGGLPADRVYLLEGDPGSGKTTMALQYVLEAVPTGESVVYVTLSESLAELQGVARSHGWSLDGVTIREYVTTEEALSPDTQVTMFQPSEVELLEVIRRMLADIEAVNPRRVVVDSLSEIRLLTQDPFRYRRHLLALKQFFLNRHCTVLLLDDRTGGDRDRNVMSIVHGVVHLEQLAPEYGTDRRRLRISKLRGKSYRGGWHDYLIRRGGLDVFPRLVASEHRSHIEREELSSGVEELDALLGGGARSGTSTLVIGPAGSGKTTIAVQFVVAAARRGQRGAVFEFDETADLLLERTASIGMPLRELMAEGRISLQQIDPAELSPGQFGDILRTAVDRDHAEVVVIDSLNGYMAAMPDERQLMAQLHELLAFLAQRGVGTILVAGQQGMIGVPMQTSIDPTYLADAIILLRFFEAEGRVKKAISVIKKRSGDHEDAIRELRIGPRGIEIGIALTQFRGVLSGTPVFEGVGPARGKTMVRDSTRPSPRKRKRRNG